MASFIIILIVIIAVLLGLVVLVQNPKGGGLAVGFQGSSQIGGVQRTTDFLEKATWYLVISLFVLTILSSAWYSSKTTVEEGSDSMQTEQTGGGEDTGTGEESAPAQ